MNDIPTSFTVPFTGYIDAIMNSHDGDTAPEFRRPELSQWHVGQFQENQFPFGTSSDGDIDLERTSLIHLTIDDDEEVQELLRTELHDKVDPFAM